MIYNGGTAGVCACVSGRRGLGEVVAGDDGPGKKIIFRVNMRVRRVKG